jgi:hypothetical protein
LNALRLTLLIAFAFIMSACGAIQGQRSSDVSSRLDTDTGVTYVTLDRALGFAASQPQLTTSARDYVYVGPVEINRMGSREHFLWVGVATTIDRNLAGVTLPGTEAISFVLDGEPMILSLQDWSATGRSSAPYDPPAPVLEHLGVAVSIDQIALITQAKTLELRLHLDNERVRRFKLWGGKREDWQSFLTDRGIPARLSAQKRR